MIPLQAGLRVELVSGLCLEVVEVDLPDEILSVLLDGEGPVVLTGSSWSLIEGPPIRLVHRYDPDPIAHIWSTGNGWMIRPRAGAAAPLGLGFRASFGGAVLEAHPISAHRAGLDVTQGTGRVDPPLRLVLRHDVVEIHRDGHATVVMNGLRARLICELYLLGGLVSTDLLSAELWRSIVDPAQRQIRYNKVLHRIRRGTLEPAGIRRDLLTADGKGNLLLLLNDGDVVIDEM